MIKKLLKKIKKIRLLPKQHKIILASLAVLTLMTVYFGVANGQNAAYETQISFDKNEMNPLVLKDKKVEIVAGLSNEDKVKLDNRDPEAIKILMQSLSPEYGVDWKLVYAIGYHESANFNSYLAESKNNFFGRKAVGGGYAQWSSAEEGIRNEFEYLKRRYFDIGLNTPAKINPVYAEDPKWHIKVETVMNKL